MARLDPQTYGANLCAFLDMLAHSEGTSTVVGSDDGYNVLAGGGLFHDYSEHPLVSPVLLRGGNFRTTAAGRYQLLHRYFAPYRVLLGLADFGPISQDRIARQQIKECGALDVILAGDIAAGVRKCKSIWASLPGAGYGQPETTLESLQATFDSRIKSYLA